MNVTYIGEIGVSLTHIWLRKWAGRYVGKWWVCEVGQFCFYGPAVVDDFGNLVEVSA